MLQHSSFTIEDINCHLSKVSKPHLALKAAHRVLTSKLVSMLSFSKIGPSETEWRAFENQKNKRQVWNKGRTIQWLHILKSITLMVSKSLPSGSWRTNLTEIWHSILSSPHTHCGVRGIRDCRGQQVCGRDGMWSTATRGGGRGEKIRHSSPANRANWPRLFVLRRAL